MSKACDDDFNTEGTEDTKTRGAYYKHQPVGHLHYAGRRPAPNRTLSRRKKHTSVRLRVLCGFVLKNGSRNNPDESLGNRTSDSQACHGVDVPVRGQKTSIVDWCRAASKLKF
jgi:hypothetical protein